MAKKPTDEVIVVTWASVERDKRLRRRNELKRPRCKRCGCTKSLLSARGFCGDCTSAIEVWIECGFMRSGEARQAVHHG